MDLLDPPDANVDTPSRHQEIGQAAVLRKSISDIPYHP